MNFLLSFVAVSRVSGVAGGGGTIDGVPPVGDQPCIFVWLFFPAEVPGSVDEVDPAAGQAFAQEDGVCLRHHLIVSALDDADLGLYPRQQLG